MSNTNDFSEQEFNEFLNGYIEAMLGTELDDNDDPLDRNYSVEDIDPKCYGRAQIDCMAFLFEAAWMIRQERRLDYRWTNFEMAGHDLLLTRNGHGAGFWEEADWPAYGDSLDKLCEKFFKEVNAYVGDDGKVYIG